MDCELYYGSGCEYYQSRLLPQGGSSFVCTKQQNKSKLPVDTLAELWSSFICFYFPLFQKNEVLLISNRFIYLLIYGPVFSFFFVTARDIIAKHRWWQITRNYMFVVVVVPLFVCFLWTFHEFFPHLQKPSHHCAVSFCPKYTTPFW